MDLGSFSEGDSDEVMNRPGKELRRLTEAESRDYFSIPNRNTENCTGPGDYIMILKRKSTMRAEDVENRLIIGENEMKATSSHIIQELFGKCERIKFRARVRALLKASTLIY